MGEPSLAGAFMDCCCRPVTATDGRLQGVGVLTSRSYFVMSCNEVFLEQSLSSIPLDGALLGILYSRPYFNGKCIHCYFEYKSYLTYNTPIKKTEVEVRALF